MSTLDTLKVVNVSDVGQKRPHNEDSTITDSKYGIMLLADGMGGYKAGEVASTIAVCDVYQLLKIGLSKIGRNHNDDQSGISAESILLEKAISAANLKIYDMATHDNSCQGMGTTIVACMVLENSVIIAHVGDSRMYRLRGDDFEQVTKDHSLIQELVDRGLYTQEEAMANTPKNLVTRALGIENDVQVDVVEEPIVGKDIYLLCSDGLNDMVNDEEIHLTLSKYSANLVQAANELVRLANNYGGKDNISIVLLQV